MLSFFYGGPGQTGYETGSFYIRPVRVQPNSSILLIYFEQSSIFRTLVIMLLIHAMGFIVYFVVFTEQVSNVVGPCVSPG